MIRKDREITHPDYILDILRRGHVCRLALNDSSTGYPYIVPLNYGIIVSDDGSIELCFHCARRGRKLDLIDKDPRASFEVECDVELVYNASHGHNTDIFKSVIGHGKIRPVTDPREKTQCLQILTDRYHKTKITVTDSDAAKCAIFILKVMEMTGKEKKVSTASHDLTPR